MKAWYQSLRKVSTVAAACITMIKNWKICIVYLFCINKCTYLYIYIHIAQNYITNAPTNFGTSAPYLGNFDNVIGKVIKG